MKQILDSFLSCVVWSSENQANLLAFIAGLPPNCVTHDDIEDIGEILAKMFSVIDRSERENVFNQTFLKSDITVATHKIILSKPRFFTVLLVNSLRHQHPLFSRKNKTSEHSDFFCKVVTHSLKNIKLLEQSSIYLLRTLNLILSKNSYILSPELSMGIIKSMHWVSVSPLPGFKQYAHSITKICLNFLTNDQKEIFCDHNIIPVRGIETYNLMNLFSEEYLEKCMDEVINSILSSFKTNIENKDGSILYERLLIFSFEIWRLKIWPLFLPYFRNIDQEGEFYQSLLKYWIPISVNVYKQDFYLFVRNEAIDSILKGHILLETRKKGLVNVDVTKDIWKLFHNLETTNICIRILSIYHKKSLHPSNFEIKLVLEFLRSNIETALGDEDVKSLNMFFSQFILYAHTDLPASEGKFEFYRDTIDLFYQFCCHSLETDHFEVGLQVAQIILNILSGSYKKLLLIYKLERKYYYEEGENALFQRLKGKFLKFTSLKFQNKLKQCLLMKGGTSKCLTNLILSHYPQVCFIDIATFRKILSESAKISSLKNIEKISNLSRILLNDRNPSNIAFVNKTVDIVLEDMNDFETTSTYSNVLLLTVINVATQNLFIIDSFPVLIEKCFDYMLFQINQNASSKMDYQSLKTYEAFINTIVNITIQKLDSLWPHLNRNFVIDALMKIIGISNMKKPVTISAIALKHLFVKMEECDIMYKMLLSDEVLRCISDVPTRSDLKIRRYPEYRLVLHALCMSDNNPSRLFLKWIIQDLIQIIKNDESSDIAVSRSIHSIEILVSENTLHSHTLFYMEEIIILCIELFKNESWIIRNADLQLAKALIDRFFGVSLNTCNRPKTIEDLFVLFPNLPSYFFKILSMEILDERASMAFQFFLESQIKTSLWTHVTGECLSYFRVLFIDIIKNYPNHFGKLAVKSLVALTMNDDIPNVVLDICSYIKSNFINMRSNIISNVIFLVKELHEKYAKGSMNSTSTEVYLHGLSEFLRKHNSCVFDFMLLKVNTSSVVMNKIKSFNDNDFQNRIWLNNYIPLLVNSKYYLQYLDDILSFNLPVCQKVKVLSMLVSKFERGCLKPADMPVVFKIIVQNCISEDDKYLLLCYYKVASLIISSIQVDVNIDNELFPSKFNSLYKAHVFVLYQSISKASILKTFQLDSIVKLYSSHVGMTDDIDSDIAYSLKYFPEDISADLKYILYKIVFCYSLQQTTYLEIYNFITEKTKKRYYSILPALECLLSQSFITKTLGVYSDIFYCNINRYVKEMCKNSGEQNGFYEIQIDFVVPIDFLAKLLKIKDLYS